MNPEPNGWLRLLDCVTLIRLGSGRDVAPGLGGTKDGAVAGVSSGLVGNGEPRQKDEVIQTNSYNSGRGGISRGVVVS